MEHRGGADGDDIEVLRSQHRLVAQIASIVRNPPGFPEGSEVLLVDVGDCRELDLLGRSIAAGVTRIDFFRADLLLVVHPEDAHPGDASGADDSSCVGHGVSIGVPPC
jgi:hypothetical protein